MRTQLRVVLLLTPVLGVVAVGCNRGREPQGDTAVAKTPVSEQDPATISLHQRLRDDAVNNYTLGTPVSAIEVKAGNLDHGGAVRNIHVSARSMTRNTSAGPETQHFVADFVSDKKYKKLGMGEQDNFVMMIPIRGDTLYVMVPSDLRVRMSFLDYDKQKVFDHPAHQPPQAVKEVTAEGILGGRSFQDLVIGACVEGSQCPSGHCAIGTSGEAFTSRDYQSRMQASRQQGAAARDTAR